MHMEPKVGKVFTSEDATTKKNIQDRKEEIQGKRSQKGH